MFAVKYEIEYLYCHIFTMIILVHFLSKCQKIDDERIWKTRNILCIFYLSFFNLLESPKKLYFRNQFTVLIKLLYHWMKRGGGRLAEPIQKFYVHLPRKGGSECCRNTCYVLICYDLDLWYGEIKKYKNEWHILPLIVVVVIVVVVVVVVGFFNSKLSYVSLLWTDRNNPHLMNSQIVFIVYLRCSYVY